MSIQQRLDHLLARTSRGDWRARRELLRTLKSALLLLPAKKLVHKPGEDQVRAAISTVVIGGRRYTPVFSKELLLSQWSKGKSVAMPVVGGDLDLVLPHGLWVQINPGTRTTVSLSPGELYYLSTEDGDEEDLNRAASFPPLTALDEEAMGVLSSLLVHYPEVKEGYFIGLSGADIEADAVLGLLCEESSADTRFLLTEEIAHIAKRFYGDSGAISIFDDLAKPSSRSWDLFSARSPFYVKDENPLAGHKAASRFSAKPALDEDVPIYKSARPRKAATPIRLLKM